jgi:menaquinone-dependent protoporphyrinogen oxidase
MMAMSFGNEVLANDREKGKSTALLYATRYGATRETAEWIRKGIHAHVDLLDIERVSFPEVLAGYDRFIVGSGVWIRGVHGKVLEFLETGRDRLDGRLLATFIVCGSADGSETGKQRTEYYLNAMHASLASKPPMSMAFGGRLVVEHLSEVDRNALAAFYQRYLHDQLRDWDRTDPAKAGNFGKDVDALLGQARHVPLLEGV